MREKSSSVAVVKEDTMAAAKTPAVSKVQSEQDSNVRDEVKSVKIPKEEDKEEVKEEEEGRIQKRKERKRKGALTGNSRGSLCRENERQSHETVVPRTTVASISTKQRNPQRQRRPKLLLWLPNVAAMKGSDKLTFDTVRAAK